MGLFDNLKSAAADAVTAKKDELIANVEQKQEAKSASRDLSRQFHKTSQYGAIAVDSANRLILFKGSVPVEKSGLRKFGEASAAVMTAGMSLAVTSQLGKPKDCIVSFDDIRGYELLEDDSVIEQSASRTRGGGAVFGNVAVGGANTVSASVKGGTVDSMILRIDVNDIDNPALFINYISRRTKREGKDYQKALTECHKAMQCLDMIISQQG